MLNPHSAEFGPPSLRLRNAPPSTKRRMLLDTNIMQYAINSPSGAVIRRLNAEIENARLAEDPECGLCMTPFQLLEVLGTVMPEIGVISRPSKGQTTRELFYRVFNEARARYYALPELSQERLVERARERRSYLPDDSHSLFDACITQPCDQDELTAQIASVLAWDYALKGVYPKAATRGVDRDLAILLLVPGQSHLSRFRIAKRLWDGFYAKARHLIPEAAEAITAANKAMRLKTRRDFLDCDIYHLACFGWFDCDVTVLSCDPPESILGRIAVYKGMVEAAAAIATEIGTEKLPPLRSGIIARCEPTGEITHVFPVQVVPTIV